MWHIPSVEFGTRAEHSRASFRPATAHRRIHDVRTARRSPVNTRPLSNGPGPSRATDDAPSERSAACPLGRRGITDRSPAESGGVSRRLARGHAAWQRRPPRQRQSGNHPRFQGQRFFGAPPRTSHPAAPTDAPRLRPVPLRLRRRTRGTCRTRRASSTMRATSRGTSQASRHATSHARHVPRTPRPTHTTSHAPRWTCGSGARIDARNVGGRGGRCAPHDARHVGHVEADARLDARDVARVVRGLGVRRAASLLERVRDQLQRHVARDGPRRARRSWDPAPAAMEEHGTGIGACTGPRHHPHRAGAAGCGRRGPRRRGHHLMRHRTPEIGPRRSALASRSHTNLEAHESGSRKNGR